ncbi:sensor histidine kinase, partial [Enterococcus faecium]
YLMYVFEQQHCTDELVSLPNQIKDLYANYEEQSAIYIVLNQLPEYYESSRENKCGEIKKGTPKILDAFYIKLPITQGG